MAGLVAIYGIVCYGISLAALLYGIAFVGDFAVPKTIDTGTAGLASTSMLIDLTLIGLFAAPHSIMARAGFKRWWTTIVPPVVERSTYVLVASLLLGLLFWQWRALPEPVWHVTQPVAAAALWGLFAIGWAIAFLSTFLINHFEMFGLSQVFARVAGRVEPSPQFATPLFYRLVRHPLYVGLLLAFWSTPRMSAGHLLFAVANSFYILIGIQLEERDLLSLFGERYRGYCDNVGMLVPRLSGHKSRNDTSP